jgi:hypothetical protein
MDAPERGALMLVRFIALSLIGVAIVEVALYWVEASTHHEPVEILACILKAFPAMVGLVILIKARAIAEWISNKLDE